MRKLTKNEIKLKKILRDHFILDDQEGEFHIKISDIMFYDENYNCFKEMKNNNEVVTLTILKKALRIAKDDNWFGGETKSEILRDLRTSFLISSYFLRNNYDKIIFSKDIIIEKINDLIEYYNEDDEKELIEFLKDSINLLNDSEYLGRLSTYLFKIMFNGLY